MVGAISDGVWGTDQYTVDSHIGAAAVHAGLLKPGEAGQIQVILLPGQASYQGSNRNGVVSTNFGEFPQSMRLQKFTGDSASDTTGPIVEPYFGFGPSDGLSAGMVRYYRIQGATVGAVWGSDEYTADSDLRVAAVHAGLLQPLDIRIVKVTFMAGKASYPGTSRGGIKSGSWDQFPLGFRVELADANAEKPNAEKQGSEPTK